MIQTDNFVREAKQKALFAAYKAARKRLYEQNVDPNKIHVKAVMEAINTPQKRFWLTNYRVYRILSTAAKGNAIVKTWGTRRELYEDIIKAYERLKDKRMFKGMPLSFIASFVTYEPSKGFYMSTARAARMIKAELDNCRAQRNKKING